MPAERVTAPEYALLRAVTGVVADAASRDGIADGVCRAATDAGYRFAAFVDGDRVRATSGIAPGPVEEVLAAGDGPVDAALADGTAVARSGPDGAAARLARAAGAATLVGVPLAHDDVAFGGLVLGAVDDPDGDELATLADVGTVVAHGLSAQRGTALRERIQRELREHQRKVERLHAVAAAMVGREEESAILEAAIEAAQNILEFDICGIDVYEDGYLVPRAASSGLPEDGAQRVSVEEGIAGKTFRHNTSYLFDDVREVEDAVPAQAGYRSVISVPIDDVGVFQAGSREVGGFTDEDVELAELLMSHVAETLKRCYSERALRESEQQYRTVVEGSHDAIFVLQEGEVAFVNDRTCELTGYDREAVVGSDAIEFIHPEDRGRLDEYRRNCEVAVERTPTSFTARIRRPDGEVRHCEFRLTTIGHDGEPAVLGSVRDVTERVEHERRLRRQNERLEEFASILSHDLRNPLNVAQGSLDLARETGDGGHLDRAERALDRMETLIQDVLDLARKGRVVDDPETVGLATVVGDAWRQVDSPEAVLDVGVGDLTVEADPGRLQTLLENLFRNAVEHVGPGVTVEVGALADGFYVADDGPGIPPEERDRVFERGYTSADEGTGFGLAIARNVAEAHGWELSVADGDGGARFEVTGVTVG